MENKKEVNLGKALVMILTAAALIVVGKGILKFDTTVVLLLAGGIVSVEAVLFGCGWNQIQGELVESFKRIAVPIYILIAIGLMVGSWTLSGTIPTLMYYGMKVLSPTFYLPITFLLCFVMTVTTGTSWGTISTIGIALIGIAQGLGVPLAYSAGAIVSGAYMGDALSPISDAPLIASAACDVPLMEHIKISLKPKLPAGIVALVLYTILGLTAGGGAVQGDAYGEIITVLPQAFQINVLMLLPLVVVMALIIMKKPTIPTLVAGAATGFLVALLFQKGTTLATAVGALASGFKGDTGSALVNGLVQRGGVNSMIGTVGIVIGATAFAAPLKASGAITTLLNSLSRFTNAPKPLMLLSWVLHPLFFLVAAAYYVSYPMIGGLLSPAYDKLKIDKKYLSMILGSTGIAITAIIPWTPAGAFTVSQLGVATGEFLPFAFFNWLTPIICLVMILTGIGITKSLKKEKPSVQA